MSVQRKYYALADALKMSLTRENKTGKIVGEKTFSLSEGTFELKITCRIEQSYETMSQDVLLMMKMKGNLHALVIATGRDVWLFYVNIAKVSELVLQTLDAFKPPVAADYVEHMAPAIVRSFKQTGKTWSASDFTV